MQAPVARSQSASSVSSAERDSYSRPKPCLLTSATDHQRTSNQQRRTKEVRTPALLKKGNHQSPTVHQTHANTEKPEDRLCPCSPPEEKRHIPKSGHYAQITLLQCEPTSTATHCQSCVCVRLSLGQLLVCPRLLAGGLCLLVSWLRRGNENSGPLIIDRG